MNVDEVLVVEHAQWEISESPDVDQTSKKSEEKPRKVLACLQQIPLILAWTITIHKSQGLTIDKVSMNLQGLFFCFGL
jgi:ATP-dependent exoDNAse (exonuclease V) alpha subunit